MIENDLVIVSNRQPYRHEFGENGAVVLDRPGGGVTAALDTVAAQQSATWIAWGDGAADKKMSDSNGELGVPPSGPAYILNRVWLSDDEVEKYYRGYANRVLWPLCHHAMDAFTYRGEYWEQYRAVNRKFASEILQSTQPESTIWFQDYHFGLAPAMVREHVASTILQFWHIPWPAEDIFRYCPQRRELLEGLLANDVIGFHADRYGANFLDCVNAFVPNAEVDTENDKVTYNDRPTSIETVPLGVDVTAIASTALPEEQIEHQLRHEYGIRGRIILGVDRLDYTKGIPERLAAYESLLEQSPELHESVTFVQKCIPSREGIPEYQELQEAVQELVDEINHRFGTPKWQPVVVINEFLPAETLYGLYRAVDVMVVTPVCDGMNLVAQEFVAAQGDTERVLILSEFTGVAEYLSDGAIVVNPYDTDAQASAMKQALSMNPREKLMRMYELRKAVDSLDITTWASGMFTKTRAVEPRSELSAHGDR